MSATTEILYTPEDLLAMPDGDDYELVDGRLVERNMGAWSVHVATRLMALIVQFDPAATVGLAPRCPTRAIKPFPKGKIRKPDLSFIRLGRLPGERVPDGHIKLAPDLAVEVISPNDIHYETDRKVEEYLKAGTRLVWVVNPEVRTVLSSSTVSGMAMVSRAVWKASRYCLLPKKIMARATAWMRVVCGRHESNCTRSSAHRTCCLANSSRRRICAGIPLGARPVFQVKKNGQAMIVGTGFMKKLGAIFGGQFTCHRRLCLLRGVHAGMMKVDNRFRPVRPPAIRVAIDFILFQPPIGRRTRMISRPFLPRAIRTLLSASYRPAVEKIPQIQHSIHDLSPKAGSEAKILQPLIRLKCVITFALYCLSA